MLETALSEQCMVSSMLVKMLKARSTGNEPSMSTASSSMAFFPKKPAIQITVHTTTCQKINGWNLVWKKENHLPNQTTSFPNQTTSFCVLCYFPGRKLFWLDHKRKQITSIEGQTHSEFRSASTIIDTIIENFSTFPFFWYTLQETVN